MNNITETRYTTPPLGGSAQNDSVQSQHDHPQIGAGALDPLRSPPQRQQDHDPKREFHRPPAPRQPVTLRLAEGALNRILDIFGPRVDGKPLTVTDIERTPMEAMTLAASLLGVKALGDNANLKALAMEIRTHGAESLRLRQNEDLRKQVEKSIEDQAKAQKAGIFSAIVDWIVSIAEVVSGIGKILIGDFAGGAMDVAAGCAGLVKAACETLALIDKDNAEKYQSIADVAGKVQLAFEIAGMAVDLVSVGRGVMASKSIAKATETVMEGAAGEALHTAVTQGSEAAIKTAAAEIGKQVAEQVSEQVTRSLAEQSARFLGQGHLLEAFSKQAIEQMVTRAVETAAKRALQSGVEISAKELSKQVIKEVQREVIKAIVGACIDSVANNAKSATRSTLQSVNGVYQGVITKERAELQKVIQQLINETDFMQFMLDEFEKIKKRAKENIGSLMDGAGKALSAAADTQQKSGAMLSSIAANIA
ncbi:type III secretion system translocon protein [Edwardsiella anguillarum]|uniref:type III secretion system translocon protein n=1 Tax=Edwardsiella TaxID=635 RepID=UPI00045C6CEA|nr:type III secretion system translocon protein [Edwardsiella anguillarum]AKM48566.1 type III secretion protein [Edwardsiella sp. EA181011]GAJ67836.1 protein EseC [Edwardsiella piscicida]RFS99704.1 type III secretion protein [Edwardsiella anguillarum]BET80101.1 type III secretion system translocon protein [Edwardsiella anguillarum]BET83390.1 type III secretion system translocon protein [Edwardsiella anguillarum]